MQIKVWQMEWTQRLRVRQLHLLVALHENGNVSRTASQMGVTQPGLSKWLGELERDLGVKLFERNSRGLKPTSYCVALVGHARAVIGELDRTQATIRLMSDGASGNFVVGTTPTAATALVPKAAAYFRRQFPDAYIQIIEDKLDALLPRLKEGRLDCVIGKTDQARFDAGMRCDLLFKEHLRIVVSRQHPLARRRKVAWEDVRAYPWISPLLDSPLRKELEQELALANQPAPRYRLETGSTVVIIAMLQEGDLVSAMSARVAAHYQALGQIVALPLATQCAGSVGVIRRRAAPNTALMRAFMEGLRLTV